MSSRGLDDGAARHRVLVVGGGFAGFNAARSLRGYERVDVTLIDRKNHHLFQPLLYQVATGGLSPSDIAAPLRWILTGRGGARVLLGEVCDVDARSREVVLLDGERVPYDTLVLATGADTSYFGHEAEWQHHAPGLKDLEDATRIRARVLCAFEQAERERDPARRAELLTFVVVGGGPTGVELAGALAELARDTLRHDFRSIDPTSARIVLLEAAERVLLAFPPHLAASATRALERLGVEVRAGVTVTAIGPGTLSLRTGAAAPAPPPAADAQPVPSPPPAPSAREEEQRAGTILWAAGVRPGPCAGILERSAGARLERGRVRVGADLSLPEHPEILVLGDLAHCEGPDGAPLPGLAPVAMQQGKHAARVIRARLEDREPPPFRYRDNGVLAIVGRSFAVAKFGRLEARGLVAWLLWLFVHLLYLVGFASRALVLFQWGWSYVTRGRSSRLILGAPVPVGALDANPASAEQRGGGS